MRSIQKRSTFTKLLKKLVLVLSLSISFSGFLICQSNQSLPEPELKRTSVEPKSAASTYLHQIPDPLDPDAVMLCGNGKFRLIFTDINEQTGLGFDDPTLGLERQNCACEVLNYITSVISIPATIGDPNPTIDIVFDESVYDINNSVLAVARPIFPDEYLTTPGYYGGYLYDFIITGVKPDEDSEDGAISVNFGHSYNYCQQTFSNSCSYDFFSLLLHEITHLMGFVSFVTNQPTEYDATNSIKSLFAPGSFSKYDEKFGYYFDNSIFHKIVDLDLFDATNGINPTLPTNALISNNVWLNDELLSSHKNHPIISFAPFSPGTSVSHFDNSENTFGNNRALNKSPMYDCNYVMEGYFRKARKRRVFSEPEVKWFEQMGFVINSSSPEYLLITNYPPQILGPIGTMNWNGEIQYPADATIPFGNSDIHFTTSVCNPLTIPISSLNVFDENSDPVHI